MSTKKQELEANERGEGCLGKSKDDEPIFVLCARDPLAPYVVETWAKAAHDEGVRPGKVVEARAQAQRMRAWRMSNQ